MATILTKKSDTSSSVPLAADLTNAAGGAELAVNTADKRLYSKTSGGSVVELGTNPSTLSLPNGTANGVPYLNGSKVLTTGSALTFDGTNFGVGTGTPFVSAAGRGNISINGSTDSILAFGSAGVNTGYLYATTSGLELASIGNTFIRFSTSGSEQMRLTSTGLGIGTSSPATKLDVVGVVKATGAGPSLISVEGSGQLYAAVQLQATSSGGKNWSLVSNATSSPLGAAGSLSFRDSSLGTTHMTLDSSGNLGLGVTPSVWDTVKPIEIARAGSFVGANSSGSTYLGANTRFASGSWRYANNGPAGLYTVEDNIHFWRTAPSGTAGNAISFTQAMTLDASGNLLVGTTSAGAVITAKTQTASGSALATLGTSGDTPFQAVLVTKFDNDSTTSQNFIQFQINNGGANCGKIVANGANTAAFASTSDARAKENITDLPSQLGNILALRPVEFDYIPALGGGHQVGFIAQEMQQVFPDVVSGDGTEENILAITGWSKTEARLVKAIQDQQAIIDAQQAALTTLTARVAALEVA